MFETSVRDDDIIHVLSFDLKTDYVFLIHDRFEIFNNSRLVYE